MHPDPIAVANLSLSLATKATEALSALRERAQRSKDIDIKEQINALFDVVLELKEVNIRLLDENRELKTTMDEQQHPPEKPQLRQVGEANYYYKGEEGPFCQPCYDDKGKFVALSPQKQQPSGSVTRTCLVCRYIFYEVKVEPSPAPQRYAGPHR
jgi:hypothetical protein